MKTKGLLLIATLLFCSITSSCINGEGDYSRIEDLYGTEWAFRGEGTLGLKFYANYQVTSYLDNQYGIETISGTYEYIASSKTLSFKGLTWYSADTGNPSIILNGAHIIDDNTMEVIVRFPEEGETENVMFYKQ